MVRVTDTHRSCVGDPVSERKADRSRRIEVKTKDQIERMRRVCKVSA